MTIEGAPNPELEAIRKGVEEDLDFLSKFKDADTLEVLMFVPGGEIPGGSGHEMEPVMVQEDDSKQWETRSVKELRELILQCQKESDIWESVMMNLSYPLVFKDPITEEEHQSATGKRQQQSS